MLLALHQMPRRTTKSIGFQSAIPKHPVSYAIAFVGFLYPREVQTVWRLVHWQGNKLAAKATFACCINKLMDA